jgi:hypothetical protein
MKSLSCLFSIPLSAFMLAAIARNSNHVSGFSPVARHLSLPALHRHAAASFSPKKVTYPLSMSVEGDFDPEALAKAREERGSLKARARSLYKFTRPHTIRGTILASIAGTIRALVDTPGAIANAKWGYMLPRAFVGMFALLLGNAFIVGINQIYDEDIDKLNKPFLPVANGEMSKRFAWVAVVFSGVVGPFVV